MDFIVFQNKVTNIATQMISDVVNLFNQASGGCLVMGSGQVLKDTLEELSFGIIDGLVTDRNPYAKPGVPVDQKVLATLLTNSINASGRVGPVTFPETLTNKIGASVDQVAAIIATQASEALLQWYLNAAISSFHGAVTAGAGTQGYESLIYTQPKRKNANAVEGSLFPVIPDFPLAASAFGDRADNIKVWIMSGLQWAQFTAYQAMPSAQLVFQLGNMKVFSDGLGRQFLVSDVASAQTNGQILGLSQAAVAITTNGLKMAAGQALGEDNIRMIWQGEFDFNVSVKGYRLTDVYRNKIEAKRGVTIGELFNAFNWQLDSGSIVGQAPDNAGKEVIQMAPKISIKETAGVIIQLTGTTQDAPVAGG